MKIVQLMVAPADDWYGSPRVGRYVASEHACYWFIEGTPSPVEIYAWAEIGSAPLKPKKTK